MNAPGWAVIVPTIAPWPSQASTRELERAQAVARPRQLPLRAGSADAGHDHDLVVVLELVEPDEHRAADLEHRARRLEPALESAASGAEDEARPCEAARASSKVSSRMPPLA